MNKIGLNANRIINFKSNSEQQLQAIPQVQYEQPLPDAQLPAIYNISSGSTENKSFVDTLKKFDMLGIIYPWFEHPLMMLGSCFGLSWAVDKFSKSCRGDYEKSLVGKTAKLGDNIQESKFVQSKPFQTVLGWGKATKNKISHFFRNSDLVNAFFKTPSQPELGFVKDELLTMQQRVVHDFTNVTSTLKLTSPEPVEFIRLGVDKNETKFLEKFFEGATLTEEKACNAIQLKRIGLEDDAIRSIIDGTDATSIVKAKQLEKLGIDETFLKNLEKNAATPEDIAKVREACKRAKGIKIGAGHQRWLGKFQPIARTIGLDEVGNRLTSMSEAKTKLGRALSTFVQKCHRGFTFGGGKGGVLLFVSPILVDTILDVKKAEPNEKIGTAAHGLIHACSWVFTFPIALEILHRFGGMQYAGMSAEDVKKARDLIKEFNEKANPFEEKCWYKNMFGLGKKKAADKTFQSLTDYNVAKATLKEELRKLRGKNVKDQNLLTKIGKGIGKFLTMDLETIASYKNGSHLGNAIRKTPNFFKNLGGVPLRIGLWAGLTMGVLDPLINKGIKGCFGSFYDRFKEEENVEAKKGQKNFLKEDLRARLIEANNRKVYGMNTGLVENPMENHLEVPNNLVSTQTNKTISNQLVEENNESIDSNIPNKDIENTKDVVMQEKDAESTIPVIADNEVKSTQVDNLQSNDSTKDFKPLSSTENSFEKKFASNGENVQETESESENKNSQVNLNKDNYTYIPPQKPLNIESKKTLKRDNYTYIPSSENKFKKEEKPEDVNKYIPSQQGVKFNKTFDNSGLEAALRRADRAEQRAIETLAGNFGNM